MRWISTLPESTPQPPPTAAVQSLEESWSTFPIVRLRFTLRSQGLSIPAFHASVWHGMIGARLREIDPLAYLAIWEKEQSAPYALRAPIGPTKISDGDTLFVEITLFGQAIAHLASVLAAVDAASSSLGQVVHQGQRGRAIIEEIYSVTPTGIRPVRLLSETELSALQILAGTILQAVPKHPTAAVRLILDAPLRLKDNGQFITQHPSFTQLLRRVFGRMRQLQPNSSAQQAKEILQHAVGISDHGSVRWMTLDRWSARQKQNMPFGGLVGFLEYHGALEEFLPWLALGAWLHVGGKSTFGFGTYQLQVAE